MLISGMKGRILHVPSLRDVTLHIRSVSYTAYLTVAAGLTRSTRGEKMTAKAIAMKDLKRCEECDMYGIPMGGDLAPNLGDQKKFSRPNFRKNVHFQGKNV